MIVKTKFQIWIDILETILY